VTGFGAEKAWYQVKSQRRLEVQIGYDGLITNAQELLPIGWQRIRRSCLSSGLLSIHANRPSEQDLPARSGALFPFAEYEHPTSARSQGIKPHT
jgi:hypothetical protein